MKTKMKVMKYVIVLFAVAVLLVFSGRAAAQDDAGVVYHPAEAEESGPAVKELKVGDTLPDYTFAYPLVNYDGEKVRTSDFRGKLLILEFWSMGCVSCIAGFPKLQKLQDEFGDRIQILLVNPWSDRQEVLDLLERRKKLTGFEMKLPIAFGDTALSDRFPMVGVPHVVWVDEDGVIASVTDGTQLTAENVTGLLNGDGKGIRQAVTRRVERDTGKPLFVNGNGGRGEHILWHSVLSKRVRGLRPTVALKDNKIILHNSPLNFIYRFAYGYPDHPLNRGRHVRLQPNRIAFELLPESMALLDSVYVYELTAPVNKPQAVLLNMLRNDLSGFFGWKSEWETRTKKCLILTATDTALLIKEKERDYPPVWSNPNELTVHIENATIPELIFWLENFPLLHSPMPIIDETGYTGRITGVKLAGIDAKDWRDWNRFLKPFGLEFKMAYRKVDVLVVRE